MLGFQVEDYYLVDPVFHHPVRVSTYVAACAIFLTALVWRRRPLLALMTVVGWLTIWELVYSLSGYLLRHPLWAQIYTPTELAGFWPIMFWLLGWCWLAHVKGARPDWRLSLPAAAIFLVWLAFGHGGNMPGRPFDLGEEVLNVSSKSLLGLAYLFGALRTSPASLDGEYLRRFAAGRVLVRRRLP